MSKRFFSIIVSLLIISSHAQYFSIDHPDCSIRVKTFNSENKFLKKIFFNKLKERNYSPVNLIDNKRLTVGDMYLDLSISRPKEVNRKQKIDGKMVNKLIKPLYSPCIVKLELKQAKGNTIRKSDKTLFQKEVERGFPRVTFKGNERCTRALKDAFVHIPKCNKTRN